MADEEEQLLRFDHEWRVGDRALARELAVEYVDAERERLRPLLGWMTREELVEKVDQYRAAGLVLNRVIVDMWLLVNFEPQDITGEIAVTMPRPFALVQALSKERA